VGLTENPELAASLQHTGSQWVRQHHTWEATTAVYQDIYTGFEQTGAFMISPPNKRI